MDWNKLIVPQWNFNEMLPALYVFLVNQISASIRKKVEGVENKTWPRIVQAHMQLNGPDFSESRIPL